MLVDLERHDLGPKAFPVCSLGVEVMPVFPRWFGIDGESRPFPTSNTWSARLYMALFQSLRAKCQVSGHLRPSCDLWTALEAIFPGGLVRIACETDLFGSKCCVIMFSKIDMGFEELQDPLLVAQRRPQWPRSMLLSNGQDAVGQAWQIVHGGGSCQYVYILCFVLFCKI